MKEKHIEEVNDKAYIIDVLDECRLVVDNKTGNGLESEKYLTLLNTLKGLEEFCLDKDGAILSTNLEAVNVTGYEEYEIIGKRFSLFYLAEEREKLIKHLELAVEHGEISITGLLLKKQGTPFWTKMKILSLSNEKNSRVAYKVIIQGTSGHTLSENQVVNLRDEYLSVFNTPEVGFFKFKSDDWEIVKCNNKIINMIGAKDVERLKFNSFFRLPKEFDQFLDILKSRQRVDNFKFLVQSEGDTNKCALIYANYFKHQGLVEGVLLDITEHHDKLLEHERANAELGRVNFELEGFIHHASHDLRAPLHTILALVNLGLREESPGASVLIFRKIRERVEHLDLLLKDMVSIAFNTKTDPKQEPFYFEREIREIIEDLNVDESAPRIDVEIRQTSEFRTDSIRVRTIIRNLVSNALKYFNPDAEHPFVRISAKANTSGVVMEFQDNGIGIDTIYQERIYNMFFRATTRSTGAGLGLYIVKSMVDRLEGDISCESSLGRGTVFRITLPNHA